MAFIEARSVSWAGDQRHLLWGLSAHDNNVSVAPPLCLRRNERCGICAYSSFSMLSVYGYSSNSHNFAFDHTFLFK